MRRSWTWVLPSLTILVGAGVGLAQGASAQSPDGDYISGRVLSDGGTPEAGVWVIAEAKDVDGQRRPRRRLVPEDRRDR